MVGVIAMVMSTIYDLSIHFINQGGGVLREFQQAGPVSWPTIVRNLGLQTPVIMVGRNLSAQTSELMTINNFGFCNAKKSIPSTGS